MPKIRSKKLHGQAKANVGKAWGANRPGSKVVRTPGQRGASASALDARADTALRLLEDIKLKRLDARDLSPGQRRACLMLMANGTQTAVEMAAIFGVSAKTIRKDLQTIREELGREVSEWSLTTVLGQLAASADKCTAAAMKNDDPGLAWTIQRDFAKLLKELGVVGPREDRTGFRLTVESIGQGYERVRQVLGQALDPRLTGEQPKAKALPLDPRLTGEDPQGSPVADL